MAGRTAGRDVGWAPAQSPGAFDVHVVGVTFVPRYPDVVLEIDGLQAVRATRDGAASPLPAELRRNPANPADRNAVEVWAGPQGVLGHVGHLQANVARWLAVSLDRGERYDAEIVRVNIDRKHPRRPGMTLRLRLRTDLIRDEPPTNGPGVCSRP